MVLFYVLGKIYNVNDEKPIETYLMGIRYEELYYRK